MGKRIMTTGGPIAPEELGCTSAHEHILMNGLALMDNAKENPNPPIPRDEPMSIENVGLISHNGMLTYDAVDLQDERLMLAEVEDFKAAGGASMTELSAIGIRCNVAGVKRIADATGVHVVACTGFYVASSWPAEWRGRSVADYRAHMLREAREGIEGTGVMPGLVKIGMGDFSEDEANALRAAAQVAVETGLSLTVHPPWKVGAGPLEVVETVKREGFNPERLIMAHMDSSLGEKDLKTLVTRPESARLKLDYALRLLDTGALFCAEFPGQTIADEIGGRVALADWHRLAGIYALIERGYADQIVLGTDTCTKMMTRRFGGQGYLRLFNFVIPTMRNYLNIGEPVIRKIFEDNPARVFAYEP